MNVGKRSVELAGRAPDNQVVVSRRGSLSRRRPNEIKQLGRFRPAVVVLVVNFLGGCRGCRLSRRRQPDNQVVEVN